MEENHRQVQLEKAIGRLVNRVSPTNRRFAIDCVASRRNRRLRLASIASFMNTLVQLDRFAVGKNLSTLTAHELAAFMDSQHASKSDATMAVQSIYLRAIWRELLDVERLPREISRALATPRPARKAVVGRLSEPEFMAILQTVVDSDEGTLRAARNPMKIAVAWLLWDAGLRASELLSLNIGDVSFDSEAEGVTVSLRPDAPNLKTGPRSVFVTNCVPSLRAWLALHPAAGDESAPLFIGVTDRTGRRRLAYRTLRATIVRAGAAANVSGRREQMGNLTPHDLRHAAATNRARREGWNEIKMRAFFGWSPASNMPNYYAHLTLNDLRDQALRDAKADRFGRPLAGSQSVAENQAAGLLVQVLTRLLATLDATPAERETWGFKCGALASDSS